MAARVKHLRDVIFKRNALKIWEEENMNLWRMNVPEEEEAWHAPSGEVFRTAEQVADFLLKLPPGGTKAKLIQSAPSDNWVGLEIELQDPQLVWNRAKILDRVGYSVCLVQFIKDESKMEVDLFNSRVRWAKTASQTAQKDGHVDSSSALGKKKRGDQAATSSSSSRSAKRKRRDSAPLLRDEVIHLRHTRLKAICEKGAEILENRKDETAKSIVAYLEAANAALLDLEQSVDNAKELETREEVTSSALEYFSTNDQASKDKDWKVKFLIVFSGSRAGSYYVTFEAADGEIVEGIPAMTKRLKAFQCSLDETDDGWCYYRSMDVIEACENKLQEIAQSAAKHE